jgi:ATP-binding cassette, subfamily A (ABC1), member 3
LEIVLPLVGIIALIGIKSAVENAGDADAELIGATFPDDSQAWTPLSFNDYLTAIQAKRICMLDSNLDPSFQDILDEFGGGTLPPGVSNETFNGINAGNVTENARSFIISGYQSLGYNWQVPLVKCDSRVCKVDGQDASSTACEYNIIGVAGEPNRVLNFLSWLEIKYPVLANRSAFPFQYNLVKSFESSEEMDTYVKSSTYGVFPDYPKLAMGIVFNGNDPNVYDYTIRQNSTNFNAPESEGRPATLTSPDTSFTLNEFAKKDDDSCPTIGGTPSQGPFDTSCTGQYMYNGILTFQRLLHDFILDQTGASNTSSLREGAIQFVSFPTPSYRDSGFYATLEQFAPILIALGLLYPVAFMASYIAQEKELRQKELMKMMSVTETDIGWSWFMSFFLVHILTALLVSAASDSLYTKSEFLPLFIFWILSFISIITFCMTIGALTSKAVRAVLFAVITFFAGAFLAIIFPLSTTSGGTVRAISLHPVGAFSYGIAQVGILEDQGIGLTADSIRVSSGNISGYSFLNAVFALIFDCIFWGILTWYFNRVIKPDYGQALPFYFPLLPSYWLPQTVKFTVSDVEDAGYINITSGSGVPYEPVGEALQRQAEEGKSIEIHNLKKQFGEKTAVDGLNLSMYAGQITALLGHNGAGKTTTIAMLTGAIAPTSGYAKVAGKDIRTQMPAIRNDIGICLQHDCLFPMLTVREHVQFFARLKGLYSTSTYKEAEDHIDQAIRDVALFEKRNTYSKSLSGGMKRKLSVAIAFSGGSKVVILDEPTSGMDPFSRRFTWNVIRQYRQDRCIILTTHFMDEADILGDRIAIMAEGRLRCAGSSFFLKKTYGVGYQLTIEKSQQQHRASPPVEGLPESDDVDDLDDRLNSIVKVNVKEATMLNNTGSEVRFQIPIAAASKFTPMFDGLDVEVDNGNIQSYGVSMTTLDEVFLLVARGDHAASEKPILASSRKNLINSNQNDEESITKSDHSVKSRMDLSNDGMFFRHVGALTRKRAANFSRDKKAWFCTTVCPTIAVLLGLVLVTNLSTKRNLDPLSLSLSMLNKEVTTEPKNPVFYNSPEDPFACEPGSCSYTTPLVQEPRTNERYAFCGIQGRISPSYSSERPACSGSVSTGIMDFFDTSATALGVGDLSNINTVSLQLRGPKTSNCCNILLKISSNYLFRCTCCFG